MTLSTFDCIAAITEHSAGSPRPPAATSTPGSSTAPSWSVADLVSHLTEVHWFWATIVEERLDGAAGRRTGGRPAPPTPDLVDTFVAGAARLVEVLREADQSATSAGPGRGWQQDVAFVTRHQVQEAAVHHWDAVHAAGGALVARSRRRRRRGRGVPALLGGLPTTTRTTRRDRLDGGVRPSVPPTPATPGASPTGRGPGTAPTICPRRRAPAPAGRGLRGRPAAVALRGASTWTRRRSPTTCWPVPRALLHRLTSCPA